MARQPITAAQPTRHIFDAWNSSSTGHQRAENVLSGSTGWRDTRTIKLREQLSDPSGSGGRRVSDLVGAGSESWGVDGRLPNGGWERGASGLRDKDQPTVKEAFTKGTATLKVVKNSSLGSARSIPSRQPEASCGARLLEVAKEHASPDPSLIVKKNAIPQVFRHLTIYINGSTHPTISDHKLKQLLVLHGANLAIALGRRSVTHVILGSPNTRYDRPGAGVTGAGGALAAGKLQKEVAKARGKGIKYVSVEWAVESVKLGRRLPEARFACVSLGGVGQQSVHGLFAKKDAD